MICYSLLPRLPDMLVRVKEGSYVHSLPPPDIAVDCPVERELEASTVQRTADFYKRVMAIGWNSNLRYSGRACHWSVELGFCYEYIWMSSQWIMRETILGCPIYRAFVSDATECLVIPPPGSRLVGYPQYSNVCRKLPLPGIYLRFKL